MYYRYVNSAILKKMKSEYDFMKKVNMFLVRHGESEGNILQSKAINEQAEILPEERIADYELKLTERGEKQAIYLGKQINEIITNNNIDKEKILVLVSPYERARKTFELANEQMKIKLQKVHILNALREQSFGAFDFINHNKKVTKYPREYAEYKRNELHYFRQQYLGESPADVCDRIYSVLFFIEQYMKNNNTDNIFIFGHGCANRCLIMDIFNLPPEFYDDFEMAKNASIINIEKGRWRGVIN